MNNHHKIWICLPGRLLLLVTLFYGLSSAVPRAKDFSGSFTLPIEVRRGSSILPPGDYTFKINPVITPYMAQVRGPNGTFFVKPAATDDIRFSGRSSLVLARRGRTGVVRELHLSLPGLKPSYNRSSVRVYDRGALVSSADSQTSNMGGIILIYSPPKGEPSLLAQTPELIQRIPILIASK